MSPNGAATNRRSLRRPCFPSEPATPPPEFSRTGASHAELETGAARPAPAALHRGNGRGDVHRGVSRVSGVVNYLQQACAAARSEPLPPGASIPPDYPNPGSVSESRHGKSESRHDRARAYLARSPSRCANGSTCRATARCTSASTATRLSYGARCRTNSSGDGCRTQATMLTGATSMVDHMVVPDHSPIPWQRSRRRDIQRALILTDDRRSPRPYASFG